MTVNTSSIRLATETDLSQIVDIYNQAVALKHATADTKPVDINNRRKWFTEHLPNRYPIWVAECGDSIIGYCSLSPYRPGRLALRHTAEISYFIDKRFHRQGIAGSFINHATGQCRELQIKTLFALLLDINYASIQLLEKSGFIKWGHMPDVAVIDGKECGHLIYGKRILP